MLSQCRVYIIVQRQDAKKDWDWFFGNNMCYGNGPFQKNTPGGEGDIYKNYALFGTLTLNLQPKY